MTIVSGLKMGIHKSRGLFSVLPPLFLLVALMSGGCSSTPSPAAPAEVAAPVTVQATAVPAEIAAAGDTSVISAASLEDEYGIHVNLLAVTAAGGMVDLRLKIVDAAKAEKLLGDLANFPALRVGDGAVTLEAPEDSHQAVQNLRDGSLVVLLFPNSQSAVSPGTAVSVMFGDLQLAPMEAM